MIKGVGGKDMDAWRDERCETMMLVVVQDAERRVTQDARVTEESRTRTTDKAYLYTELQGARRNPESTTSTTMMREKEDQGRQREGGTRCG